jgi:hypothetical protein
VPLWVSVLREYFVIGKKVEDARKNCSVRSFKICMNSTAIPVIGREDP